MAKVKVRKLNREELPGIAVLRDAVAADIDAFAADRRVLDLDMKVDPNLAHLIAHDPDGFFTAIDRDETVGFVAAHVRSRQYILSELWVLPQHQGKGAGEVLLTRALMYGERSGAKEYLALVPPGGAVQSLLLRHGFSFICPVYLFSLSLAQADDLGTKLIRLLDGQNVTGELLQRRGQADIDRIDRLSRNINREVDHLYWLKERRHKVAVVRQGARIAAYGYGGHESVGPVAGTTQDAALSALGWSLALAAKATRSGALRVLVPARFAPAVEVLLEIDARLQATLLLYGHGLSASFDRSVLGAPNLP